MLTESTRRDGSLETIPKMAAITCDQKACDSYNILLGATGSVASVKIPLIVEKLLEIPKVGVEMSVWQAE